MSCQSALECCDVLLDNCADGVLASSAASVSNNFLASVAVTFAMHSAAKKRKEKEGDGRRLMSCNKKNPPRTGAHLRTTFFASNALQPLTFVKPWSKTVDLQESKHFTGPSRDRAQAGERPHGHGKLWITLGYLRCMC